MSDQTAQSTEHAPPPAWALWASAFVLMGLILTQADRVGTGHAMADMVASTAGGAYILMTTDGSGEEILSVIDTRNERLLMYAVVNQRELQLLERQSLPELFRAARASVEGRQ